MHHLINALTLWPKSYIYLNLTKYPARAAARTTPQDKENTILLSLRSFKVQTKTKKELKKPYLFIKNFYSTLYSSSIYQYQYSNEYTF